MPAFIIADIDVTDPEGFEAYRRLVAPTIAEAGGVYRVRGGAIEVLEGEYRPKRLVILEFPSMAAARAWYESETYAPVKSIRLKTALTNALLVEGLQGPPQA